jgi:hypothetical protein
MNMPNRNIVRPPLNQSTPALTEDLQHIDDPAPKATTSARRQRLEVNPKRLRVADPTKRSSVQNKLAQRNLRAATQIFGLNLAPRALAGLDGLIRDYEFSVEAGDIQIIEGGWYVNHTGLIRLARRKKCRGIHVEAVDSLCNSEASRFVLRATVYPSEGSVGFVGYVLNGPDDKIRIVLGSPINDPLEFRDISGHPI